MSLLNRKTWLTVDKLKFFIGLSTFLLIIAFFAGSPEVQANPAEGGVVQVDYQAMAIMLWHMKDSLPWYTLAPVLLWLLAPMFSIIVSITPTPKDDTAWSVIYKWLELNALNFWKAKDQPKKEDWYK